MTKTAKKITLMDLIVKILDSELPTGTKNSIVTHYLLPRLGNTHSVVETNIKDSNIGGVDRPSAEEIEIENNPRLKAEIEDTVRIMGGALPK